MLKYVLRRILIFLPTLVAITLLGFAIMVNAPGDPVERLVVAAQSGGELSSQSVNSLEQRKYWSHKLGLDLPIFYISLNSLAQSDTLYRVYDRGERLSLDRLTRAFGNWAEVSAYFHAVDRLYRWHMEFQPDTALLATQNDSVREMLSLSFFESSALKSTYNAEVIEAKLNTLEGIYSQQGMEPFRPLMDDVKRTHLAMVNNATPWRNYVPWLHFYGLNQYHRWLFGDGNMITGGGAKEARGLVRGDFGTSYTTKQPIQDVIADKFFWSFFFTMFSVIVSYLVSIPLGVHAAKTKDSRFDRISSVVLFVLYSMPGFWVATLLLMTFANPDVLFWLPASGVEPLTGIDENTGFFEAWFLRMPYLVIPLVAYTYSSFAFLSRTMRVSMLEVVGQDYIRTARAKGLSEWSVIYRHALRNALLPIITVFSSIFPIAIGGSVIMEVIFTIPGMGSEVFNAINNQNYPMVITVLTLTGVLTLVGYLVSDILYAVVDPRISYTK